MPVLSAENKDLKLKMAGKVAGEISSKFNLKQLEKMLLEKMKLLRKGKQQKIEL